MRRKSKFVGFWADSRIVKVLKTMAQEENASVSEVLRDLVRQTAQAAGTWPRPDGTMPGQGVRDGR